MRLGAPKIVLAGLAIALVLPASAAPTAPGRNGLIAFVIHPYSGEIGNGIVVVRADGSHRRSVTHNIGDRSPAWSPDGQRLAFERAGRIDVVMADGSGLRRLTHGSTGNHQPAWSPDGTRIVFTRVVWFCGRCDQDEVFSAKADGSDVRWLTRDTTYASSRPSWSPDGSMLLAETSGGLGLFTASGTLVRMLDAYGAEAAWQPLAIAHDVGPVTARGRAP